MTFFQSLFARVDTDLGNFYTTNLQNVIDTMGISLRVMCIIMVIGIGLGLLFGWITQSAKPLLIGVFTITVVSLLAGEVAVYNAYLGDFLRGLPDHLISMTSGGSVATVGGQLDNFGDTILGAVADMWTNSSGFGEVVAAAIFCVVFLLSFVVMAVSAAFSIILAKTVLTILVVVGPLFITLLLFKQTQEYFTKWLTYIISFAFLVMIIGAALGIVNTIAMGYVNDFAGNAADIDFTLYAPPLVILLGLYRVFEQAPSIASSVAGGIGLSAGNAAGNLVSSAASAIVSPAATGARMGYNRFVGERMQGARNARVGARTAEARSAMREKANVKKQQRPMKVA